MNPTTEHITSETPIIKKSKHRTKRGRYLYVMRYSEISSLYDNEVVSKILSAWNQAKSPLGYVAYNDIASISKLPIEKVMANIKAMHQKNPYAVSFQVNRAGENVYVKLDRSFWQAVEKTQKPGEVYRGEAWRAESDLMIRGETAKDIVDFEAVELGNEDIRKQAESLGIDLSAIPARDIIWVTTTKEAAERYSMEGEIPVEQIDIPKNAIILATDYEDGYLVWTKPKGFGQGEHVS